MNDFDDLPDPKTIKQQHRVAHDAAMSVHQKFMREEVEPLFVEIAMKLRDLEPPCGFETSQKEVFEGNWFTGKTRRIIHVTKRGWEIGYVNVSSDFPRKAYLLPDGSIYPNSEDGIQALFAQEGGSFGLINSPEARSKARSLIIERLKNKYMEWCFLQSKR